MRSWNEIYFRAQCEAGNLALPARSPRPEFAIRQERDRLPDPCSVVPKLQGTAYASGLIGVAEELRAHRFPLLGTTIETGPEICWRRDYVHGRESGVQYF